MGIALESQTTQNKFSTSLAQSCTSSDTVLYLNALPTASSGYLVIDEGLTTEETVYYSSKGSNFITLPSTSYRGLSYSANGAQGHTNNASVKMKVVSQYLEDLRSGESNTGLHTYWNEGAQPYVQSGCSWSTSSGLVGVMSSGVVYIAGRRLTVSAVASHTFTASKDTYVDLLASTTDNTATLVYTEVANNAASPALAASSVRCAIIVSGVSTIGVINQGDPTTTGPTVSSAILAVQDSLGNLICPATSTPGQIGYRQTTSAVTSSGTGDTEALALACPVIIPTNRRVKITAWTGDLSNSGANGTNLRIFDGAVGGTKIAEAHVDPYTGTAGVGVTAIAHKLASGSKTYRISVQAGTGTGTINASSGGPAFVSVELE